MVDGLSKHHRTGIIIQILVATVIFLSGVIAGSTGTVVYLKNKGILRPPRPHYRITASEIAAEIGSDYDLSDSQIKQVEQIFEKAGQSLETLRQEFEEKMETGKRQIRTEMKQVLSPEQFERWQQDFNARHGRRGPGPGPGKHGPGRPGVPEGE
ncbi:MAG TPA: hypothetical protein VMX13_07105 [Sedimentisphaerales bacterium]|nr:hypothetical protein [Sedimentisphaerales bacterium]